jgi:hypothetical protein
MQLSKVPVRCYCTGILIIHFYIVDDNNIHGNGKWLGPALLGVYMLLTNVLLLNLLIAIFK